MKNRLIKVQVKGLMHGEPGRLKAGWTDGTGEEEHDYTSAVL